MSRWAASSSTPAGKGGSVELPGRQSQPRRQGGGQRPRRARAEDRRQGRLNGVEPCRQGMRGSAEMDRQGGGGTEAWRRPALRAGRAGGAVARWQCSKKRF